MLRRGSSVQSGEYALRSGSRWRILSRACSTGQSTTPPQGSGRNDAKSDVERSGQSVDPESTRRVPGWSTDSTTEQGRKQRSPGPQRPATAAGRDLRTDRIASKSGTASVWSQFMCHWTDAMSPTLVPLTRCGVRRDRLQVRHRGEQQSSRPGSGGLPAPSCFRRQEPDWESWTRHE